MLSKRKARSLPKGCGLSGLLAGLLLTTIAMPALAEDQPYDETISYWVRIALQEDPRIQGDQVYVSTSEGIVTLSGTVANLAAKKYADLEAKKTKGVRGVVDELTVETPYRYDYDISHDVLRRILNSSTIRVKDTQVDVSGGHVTLSGAVMSWAEAEEAELLATETQGVKSVTDDLIVEYPKKRSDDEIRQDVEASLARDVYLTGLPIMVSVKDGAVTLTGHVGTSYQKERAAGDVRWIWNVKKVDNDLDVVWWDNEGTRPKVSVPTANQLQRSVYDELHADPRLDALGITVQVDLGRVTLTGSVPTFYQKKTAEKDALDVVGTAWVTNMLNVTPVKRSDEAIIDDVIFETATDYALAHDQISTMVKDGVVTLNGEVKSNWEKSHANDVVSRISGVRKVVNDLKVNYPVQYTDEVIHDKIAARLASNAATRWVADKITVTVSAGEVMLTGKVSSWSEYYAAESVALNTRGVRGVNNKLEVLNFDYNWIGCISPGRGDLVNFAY